MHTYMHTWVFIPLLKTFFLQELTVVSALGCSLFHTFLRSLSLQCSSQCLVFFPATAAVQPVAVQKHELSVAGTSESSREIMIPDL